MAHLLIRRSLFIAAVSCASMGLFAADLAVPNADYQALRNDSVAGSYRVTNLVLRRDVGTFTFQTGAFSFGHPVLGKRVFAVFIGDGTFHLAPVMTLEADHLKVVTGARDLDEVFHSAVFCFTDGLGLSRFPESGA
jgi:hypothetical protein